MRIEKDCRIEIVDDIFNEELKKSEKDIIDFLMECHIINYRDYGSNREMISYMISKTRLITYFVLLTDDLILGAYKVEWKFESCNSMNCVVDVKKLINIRR